MMNHSTHHNGEQINSAGVHSFNHLYISINGSILALKSGHASILIIVKFINSDSMSTVSLV